MDWPVLPAELPAPIALVTVFSLTGTLMTKGIVCGIVPFVDTPTGSIRVFKCSIDLVENPPLIDAWTMFSFTVYSSATWSLCLSPVAMVAPVCMSICSTKFRN